MSSLTLSGAGAGGEGSGNANQLINRFGEDWSARIVITTFAPTVTVS